MNSQRAQLVEKLEPVVRRMLHSADPLETRAEAQVIIDALDAHDERQHMLRRRNFIVRATKDALHDRVEATKEPYSGTEACAGHCSRTPKWTLPRSTATGGVWGRSFAAGERRPYCTQHAKIAIDDEAAAQFMGGYRALKGKNAWYADVEDLDEARRLADQLGVEIDEVRVEAVP